MIAHLWAWQQRSVARMAAARLNREPEFPRWPSEFGPEAEGQPHQLNAWIYETYREKPWSRVYGDWRAGFLRFLELGEEIPAKDLLEPGRYAWLEGHPLSLVLTSSYEHHEEHHPPRHNALQHLVPGVGVYRHAVSRCTHARHPVQSKIQEKSSDRVESHSKAVADGQLRKSSCVETS